MPNFQNQANKFILNLFIKKNKLENTGGTYFDLISPLRKTRSLCQGDYRVWIIFDILWNIGLIFTENCFVLLPIHHTLVARSTTCLGVYSSSCDRP